MKLLREPLAAFRVAGGLLFAAYAWLNRGASAAGDARPHDPDHGTRVTWLDRDLGARVAAPARRERAPGTGRRVPARGAAGPRSARARARSRRHRRSPPAGPEDELHPRGHRPPGLAHGRGPARPYTMPARRASEPPPRSSFRRSTSAPTSAASGPHDDARRALEQLSRAAGASIPPRSAMRPCCRRRSPMPTSRRSPASSAPGSRAPSRRSSRAHGRGRSSRSSACIWCCVTARDEGRPRAFEEVRAQLLDEWRREQEAAARNAYFAGLLRKYDVQATAAAQPLLGPALALLKGAEQ